jgi:hypothetical protein
MLSYAIESLWRLVGRWDGGTNDCRLAVPKGGEIGRAENQINVIKTYRQLACNDGRKTGK